jgi:hypothetical protein
MPDLSTLALQRLIALPFLALGGWALVAPQSVLDLCLRSEVRDVSPVATLLTGCFGAQALLCALFILTTRFTRISFAVYGVALLPFFWFDYYFYAIQPIFTEFILLDLVGNVVMLALCWMGWRAAARESL